MTKDEVMVICHNVMRNYNLLLGDDSIPPWDEAPEWMIDATKESVELILNNEDPPPSILHDHWMNFKLSDGWVWGTVKDADKKTHPCLVPFDQLSVEDRMKDVVFCAVVQALR